MRETEISLLDTSFSLILHFKYTIGIPYLGHDTFKYGVLSKVFQKWSIYITNHCFIPQQFFQNYIYTYNFYK